MALVEALDTLGPRTTYRTLLNTVRSRVERTAQEQRPELDPVEPGGLGDALFLDGTVTPVAATFTMSRSSDGWEVDAGLVHGLRPPAGDEAYVLACTAPGRESRRSGSGHGGADRAVHGGADRMGTGRRRLFGGGGRRPAPAGRGAGGPAGRRRGRRAWSRRSRTPLRRALAIAGPGGGPSPHVRLVAPTEPAGDGTLRLRVAVPSPGIARITRFDGSAVTRGYRRRQRRRGALAGDAARARRPVGAGPRARRSSVAVGRGRHARGLRGAPGGDGPAA